MMTVVVRATVSFNEVRKGDVAEVELTQRIESLVSGGYLVVDSGETEAGPGRFEKGDPERESERAGADGPEGGQPGEDPLPG